MEDEGDFKDYMNIKCEPLGCDLNDDNSASVTGFHPTLTSEEFINREVKEDKEEEKTDIKCESLDYGLERPAIENTNEHAKKQFECHKCSYKSKYEYILKRHIMAIHEKKKAPPYACEICSFRSIQKWRLKMHILRVHTEYSLKCTLCEKSFKQKRSLDSHYVFMHRDQNDSFKHLLTYKVSQCSKCSYVTGDGARFKRHLLTHEEDQSKFKFECYTCGYRCVQKSSLQTHVRLHTGQLPFLCIECNQRFNEKHNLDGHIVSRHKENEELMKTVTNRIHQCLKCSFKTIMSHKIKRHIKYCNNK